MHKNVASSVSTNWVASNEEENALLSEKKYSEADNDTSNPDDVEALFSYVLNCCAPCHSDEYSSRFFSYRPRYWNKSGCMFFKFNCDIKQFYGNIKKFHCSIKEVENTTMEFHCSIKKWRILRWNSFIVYKKRPSALYVAFLVGLTPFVYLLAGILHDP